MKIDLEKIPEEIPVIWILALALIHMTPCADSHYSILGNRVFGSIQSAAVVASSFLRRKWIVKQPENDHAFILTAEGHRILDLVEVP